MNRHGRHSRRRSSTPNLKLSPAHLVALQTADPASPPDTPVASPDFPRKDTQAAIYLLANSLAQDPNIRPYGSGHQFSYRPLEQLSPRSSSSSEADKGLSIDGDSSESASVVSVSASAVQQLLRASAGMNDLESLELDASGDADAESESDSEADCEAEPDRLKRARLAHGPATGILDGCDSVFDVTIDFTIEDMDVMDSEWEGLDVVYPTEIESESDSESPPTQFVSQQKDLDQDMMQDLENLNCSNEASDDETEPDEDDEESEFRRRQQELRRIRRVSMSSSFGKRTHSELSDSDDNDCALDVNEAGSSARRFHKRVHRGSLLFQDPPAPRIDELEEPNSSEDEYASEMRLAHELPCHATETMDTDSN